MKTLTRSRRPDTEEVRVVSELDGSFLSCDVDADGKALTVCVPGLQLSTLAMLQVFLIEQAEGGILQCEEEVIIGVEAVGIAGEAVEIEFQLVIGALRRHDAALVELRLDIAAHAVKLVLRAADHDIEVRVHQQLAVDSKLVQHGLDVGLGDLVAGVRHGTVALGLALELSQELTLGRDLDDLVIDDTVGVGDGGEERHEVGGNHIAVDRHREVGLDECGEVDLVDIDDGEASYCICAHTQLVITGLDVLHGEWTVLEVERHIAVQILVDLILRELVIPHTPLLQDVADLADLDMELLPYLVIILDEVGFVSLQRNNKIGTDLSIWTAIEESEVALGEELHVLGDGMIIFLSAEDVLFLQGIAFPEGVDDIGEDIHVGHIESGIRGILLDGVLDLDEDGTVTTGGEQDGVQKVTPCVLNVLQLSKQAVDLTFLLANHCFCCLYVLMHVKVVVDEHSTTAPLVMQTGLLFQIDGSEADGCHDDHGNETGELAHPDGEDDIAYEAGADGCGSVGQEPSSDAHELQGLLKTFEDWIAVECHIYK